MKVAVTRSINCAHVLPGTEFHGHTYRITVVLRGVLIALNGGKVMDFAELGARLDSALRDLNHRDLNAILDTPTAENLADLVKRRIGLNVTVRVQVGDDGWVETE